MPNTKGNKYVENVAFGIVIQGYWGIPINSNYLKSKNMYSVLKICTITSQLFITFGKDKLDLTSNTQFIT